MTRHYVHLARRDIAEQHKKFSPMEGPLGRHLVTQIYAWKEESPEISIHSNDVDAAVAAD